MKEAALPKSALAAAMLLAPTVAPGNALAADPGVAPPPAQPGLAALLPPGLVEAGEAAYVAAALGVALVALLVATWALLSRRRLRKALAASERRFQRFLKVSADGFWDWNLLTGECRYSPRWAEMLGLDPGRVPAHIAAFEDRVHPDELESMRARIARHQAGASDFFESEQRLMHADGSYRWHRIRARVVAWTDSGRPARMMGVQSDITAPRETERALKNNRAQMDAIFENSPAEIFLKDVEGRYLRISREFERRFNVRNQDVVGKFPEDIHYESLAKFTRDHDQEVLSTGKPVLREERARLGEAGREHVFLTLKFPTFDADGQLSGLGAIATDVTEFQRSERELAERDRLLHLMYDNIPLLLAYVDRDLKVRIANREAEQWYQRPLHQIIGQPMKDVAGEEAWEEIRDDAHRALAGERVNVDCRRSYPGGTRWVTGAMVPDMDDDGEVHGYCVVAMDITQRKLAEDTVKENERLLRLIYDNVPVMLAYVDRDRRYRTANAACAEWFDKPLGRINGWRVEDVVGQEAWIQIKPEVERAFAGEPVTVDGLRAYAGGERWVTGTVAPNVDDDGTVQGYCVTLADITERKKAEERLKASEQRLRMMADNVPGLITRVDADRRFQFVNRRSKEWLGLPESQVVGRQLWDVIGEDSYESFRPYIDQVLSGQQVSFELERPFKHAKERWTAGTLTPDYDEAGRVRGYYAMLLDISERKRAQESARQAELRLLEQQRNHQAEVERELDRVRDELVTKTRLAAIGQVAASVAHDLRNPLGAIRNAGFYLSRKLPQHESKWREYLEVMEREIVSADRIIHDLMDMTRDRELSRSRLDLGSLAREAFRRISAGFATTLECHFDRKPFMVFADADQLSRVLENLMLNALQAMNGKGRIRIRAQRNSGSDVISVEDFGSGLDGEIRGRLFEPLVTNKAKGTGLGLAICRQIVERHGGTIGLVRSDDTGTEFRIDLPRAPAREVAADSDGTADARASAG